eukprot:jgi/Bigna1/85241/estExt_fgenesh1_pg.C_30044
MKYLIDQKLRRKRFTRWCLPFYSAVVAILFCLLSPSYREVRLRDSNPHVTHFNKPVDLRGITCARPDAPAPRSPQQPANKQIEGDMEDIRHKMMDDVPGVYNIWHDKMSHCREYYSEQGPTREAARTRCVPDRDVGYTKADLLGLVGPPQGFLCFFFAKGMCKEGEGCRYFHRVPTEYDEYHCPTTHNIFGYLRDAYRKNLKGRGSILREDGQKTLMEENKYNYGNRGEGEYPAGYMRRCWRLLHDGFSEWGPVRKILVIPQDGVAYIEYFWRTSAEFAKDAMRYQYLNPADPVKDGIMQVTWKAEEISDKASAERKNQTEEIYAATSTKAMTEEERLMAEVYDYNVYPDTESRYLRNDDGNDDDDSRKLKSGEGSAALRGNNDDDEDTEDIGNGMVRIKQFGQHLEDDEGQFTKTEMKIMYNQSIDRHVYHNFHSMINEQLGMVNADLFQVLKDDFEVIDEENRKKAAGQMGSLRENDIHGMVNYKENIVTHRSGVKDWAAGREGDALVLRNPLTDGSSNSQDKRLRTNNLRDVHAGFQSVGT